MNTHNSTTHTVTKHVYCQYSAGWYYKTWLCQSQSLNALLCYCRELFHARLSSCSWMLSSYTWKWRWSNHLSNPPTHLAVKCIKFFMSEIHLHLFSLLPAMQAVCHYYVTTWNGLVATAIWLTSPSLITNSNMALGCFSLVLPDWAMVRFCLQFTSSNCIASPKEDLTFPTGAYFRNSISPVWGRKLMI